MNRLRVFISILTMMPTIYTWAYDFEKDGIFYNILSEKDKTVEITRNTSAYYSSYLTIPSEVDGYSVISIGDKAFYDCQLKRISIPSSVVHIGKDAFLRNNLLHINVDKDNKMYDSRDNCNALIETASNSLITGSANSLIPNSVTTIGEEAFYGCGLTSITIPSSVSSIGKGAFGCNNIASITVDKDNKVYDSRDNCNALIYTATDSLIQGCNSTVIPNGIKIIGEDALYDCKELTSVVIPNSVITIGEYAFGGCKELTSVVIPNSVITIGEYAFWDCKGLTSIDIPNSVTNIGDYAFSFCENISSATLSEKLTNIGEGIFERCKKITSISIPNSVTSIGEYAFYRCDLTSLTIPCNVTSIGEDAFYGCNSLTSIVVDKGNRFYDSRNDCNALIETATDSLIIGCNNTIIPDGVKIIGHNAFYKCTGLTSVNFPYGVTHIWGNAFRGCKDLKTVIIPSSVTSIGQFAFSGSTKLSDVYNYSEVPQEIVSAFPTHKTLHVIKGKKDAYAQAEEWKRFRTIIDDLEPELHTSVSEITHEDNKDAKIYTLDGRVANGNNLKNGVYIKNGKKFLSTKN